MAAGDSLNGNERLCLYGLCRYPGLNDVGLADKLGLKRSTFTVIRNRLLAEGYYSLVGVPDYGRLGCELFTFHYSELNVLGDRSRWWEGFQKSRYFNNVFLYLSSLQDDVVASVARNFSEVKAGSDELLNLNEFSGGLYENHPRSVFFPAGSSKKFLFFDFAPLVADFYKLKFDGSVHPDFDVGVGEPLKLSENEKRILCTLVERPELIEEEVAEAVGVSRQAVNKASNMLRREGVYSVKAVPNLSRLGFELLAFTHTEYNPATPIRARSEGITRIVSDSSQFLIVSTDTESVRFSAFKNYREFQAKYTAFVKHYREQNYILKNPLIRVLSVGGSDFTFYTNFHKPLRKLLGVEL